MNIATRRVEQWLVVAIEGDLDASCSSELRQRFVEWLDAGEQHFVVDLSQVPFIDSSGLGVLVGVFKRVRVGTGDMTLAGLPATVRKVFEITHLDRVFHITESVGAAVAA